LYSPEDFGLLESFGAACVAFSVFSTLGYHNAIVLPKNEGTAVNILFVSIVSTVLISLFSLFFFLTFRDEVSQWIGAPELEGYLLLAPLIVFIHGTHQSFRQWKSRNRDFKNMALSSVAEIIVKKIYQIPVGLFGYASGLNLIYAGIVASVTRNIVLLSKIKDIDLQVINIIDIRRVLIKYKKFPIYSIWSDLFSRLPAIIIAVMMVKYFGQDMLGYYGLSLMVLSLPFVLISGSIMEAFTPRVAMAKHEGRHSKMFEKLYTRLIVLMIFPLIILWFYSDILFPFVFGAAWGESGVIAQVLTVKIFFEIIFSPALSLINIMEKQELQLVRSVVSSIITAIALLLGSYYNDFYFALWVIVWFESLSIAILGGYMMHVIKFEFLYVIRSLVKHIVIIAIFIYGMSYIKTYYNKVEFDLLLIILMMSASYYLLMLYLDKELQQYLKRLYLKL